MFRIYKNTLLKNTIVFKNIQNDINLKYKYNIHNIVLIDSNNSFSKNINRYTFPKMENIYLFTPNLNKSDFNNLINNCNKKKLDIYFEYTVAQRFKELYTPLALGHSSEETINLFKGCKPEGLDLHNKYNNLLKITFLKEAESYHLRECFANLQNFNNISELSKYAYNKEIQDEIDYYNGYK